MSSSPTVSLHAPKPLPWTVRSFGVSDPGRVRANNEDVFVVGELARTLFVRHSNVRQPNAAHSNHRGHVFLVADGVGGCHAGEVASRVGAGDVEEFLLNTFRRFANAPSVDGQAALQELQAALRHADARLFEEAGQNPEWRGMATTLTLAIVSGPRLFVAHAGDSRCYLHSANQFRQLTNDHTLAAELMRSGVLTPEQSDRHPWRHVVTNVLGGAEHGVKAEVHLLDVHAGETLLLCSDGLTDMVSDEKIAEMLAAYDDPETACRQLVGEANRNGGKDNVTVIVARFSAEN